MSNIDAPSNTTPGSVAPVTPNTPADDKGKGKRKLEEEVDEDDEEDEDEEEEDEDEDEDAEAEEDDDMDDVEEFEKIDPAAILPQGRRTRGVKVDYTSEEALQKAGLTKVDAEGDEEDEFKDDKVTAD